MIRTIRTLLVCLSLTVSCAAAAFAADADSVAMDWSVVPEYRMVPGDVLNLNFGPSPEQPWRDVVREVMVRPDGRITVFPVGDVIAAGFTPRELEASLIDLFRAEFKEPRVVVEVAKLAGNQVHVLGSVMRPGSFEAGPFVTVMQAIAMAGGFADDASRNSVLVFKRDGARTVRATRLRMDAAIKSSNLALDLPLSRFDVIYVPRSTIGNISVFARQLFGSTQSALSSALIGWELFNPERVVISRTE